MKNLALKRIQAMRPYSPPLDGRSRYGGLLLDFNERTMPVADDVIMALQSFVDDQKTQVYPEYFDLENKIANYAGVKPDQIMITNGTDQAIDIIFRTFADKDDTVIIPEPSFAMYAQYALLSGNRIVSPLYDKKNLAFPLRQVLSAINDKVKLIVVCNPNSPTGTLLPIGDIGRIARKAPNSIIYVDEAYFEFSRSSAEELIKKYPNIIISRTFSKAFGLASLRIGYVIADRVCVNEMLKVRGPYDVNRPAAYAASAALDASQDMTAYVNEIMDRAKPMIEEFFGRNGVTFYPSAGNFILFRPGAPKRVLEALRRNNVLVRPQDKPNIEGSLRLTVGTVNQMRRFIEIYETAVLGIGGQKYAFLDRDGTLIHEPLEDAQVDSLEKLRILDGAIEGLKQLQELGFKLVMVTNQDGLGTPVFPTADFQAPQQVMLQTFQEAGIEFEEILICPHFPADRCACRKPKTGLLDDFLKDRSIDVRQTFVCGDQSSDEGLARKLGLKFVPMTTNGNFYQAVELIIKGVNNENIIK